MGLGNLRRLRRTIGLFALASCIALCGGCDEDEFGVNGGGLSNHTLHHAKAAGATWVHLFHSWDAMEPAEGQFNWYPAAEIEYAAAQGMKISVVLHRTPLVVILSRQQIGQLLSR